MKLVVALLVVSLCPGAFAEGPGQSGLHAFDPSFHSRERDEAVELRRQLVSGELSPWDDRPGRTVFELAGRRNEGVGPVLALEEEREGFVINVILSETEHGVRVARYLVPKLTFDAPSETASAGSPSQPDLFSFCAVEGRAIVLTTDGDPPPEAVLLDAAGVPLSTVGPAWKAPYTGVYYAQVPGDAAVARVDYLLSIDATGRGDAQASADLSVTTTDAPEPVEAGGLLTYTVAMLNSGPDAALDAEMLAFLPDVTTFQSIAGPMTNGSWSCTVPAIGRRGKVSCTTKCFGPGNSATFTITVRVDPCVGSTSLTATLIASSTTADPNPANSMATEQTPVIDPGTCDDANVCTVGDQCGPGVGYQENFDDVSAPFLPAGWTATLVVGPVGARPWRTVTTDFYTAPNSMFSPDAGEIRDSVLDSPGIPIVSAEALLLFRNRYVLEKDNDGGVLEIKIGDGPFQDILDAGGSFAEGGYNGTISRNFGSPIAGRRAWTDVSAGFVPTTVNLPPAAAGQTIVIRFRLATDRSLGNLGQWIDAVTVTGRDVCRPGPQAVCDDANACTVDACDAVLGCGHVSISCDDGNGCNGVETCVPANGCVAGTPLSCNDGDACNGVETCNPASGCVAGIPKVCAAPEPCRGAGTCDSGSGLCSYPPLADGTTCDDGSVCSNGDACLGGVCHPGVPMTCSEDGDPCTVEVCNPVDGCWKTVNMDRTPSSFSENRVDGRDLVVLADAWNRCHGQSGYNSLADLDPVRTSLGLTCIDASDFHLFMDAFGRTCAP